MIKCKAYDVLYYINELEQENETLKQTHDYDLKMIDEVKRNSAELLQENRRLKEQLKQRDEVIDRAKKQTHFIDEQLKKYVTLIPSKEIADLLDILNNKGDNKWKK